MRLTGFFSLRSGAFYRHRRFLIYLASPCASTPSGETITLRWRPSIASVFVASSTMSSLFVPVKSSRQRSGMSTHRADRRAKPLHSQAKTALSFVPLGQRAGSVFRFLAHISGQFKKNERNHLSQKWDVLVARVHSIDQSAGRPLRHARFVVIDL